MFGISFAELLVIGGVILVFVKPEDLPHLFRKIGQIYGQLRRISSALMNEFQAIEDMIKDDDSESDTKP